jgi:hypothetical protein
MHVFDVGDQWWAILHVSVYPNPFQSPHFNALSSAWSLVHIGRRNLDRVILSIYDAFTAETKC